MLKKLTVPTHKPREHILKYFNKDSTFKIPPKQKRKHTPYFSNILCKFYAKNSCTKGDACIFSHDTSQFQCPNGKECNRINCNFKHDEELKIEVEEVEKTVYISPFEND